MADRLHLSSKHRRVLDALLRKHLPDVEVWAYGSRVNGRSHDGSDLDLVLRAPDLNEIPSSQLWELEEAIRESNIPFLVEARDWARLPERFHQEIEREYVVLTGAEDRDAVGRWRETTLGNVVELKRGFDLPQRERIDGDIPVVSSSGVIGRHRQSKIAGPGVVTGRYGTLGQVFYIEDDFWPLNTALYVQDFKGNDPRFISFLLKSLDVSKYADKAAVPGLNRNHLHREIVRVPSRIVEQRAVAHILGTLDDKIEINRRMNETLEAMAQALFKSWFVDFDPVRAKMEGRDTGLPKDIADIFPETMVDSELGEIPEGWGIKALGELIEFAYGKALKAEDRNDGPIPVYGSNGQIGWHNEKLVGGPGLVVGRKGNPGVVTWAQSDFFPIDTAFYVVSKSQNPGLHFLFYALTDQNLSSVSADSAVPGLNRNLAYMNSQLVPDAAVLDTFRTHVIALFHRRECLEAESRALASLRNAMLPKLTSGALRTGHVLGQEGAAE